MSSQKLETEGAGTEGGKKRKALWFVCVRHATLKKREPQIPKMKAAKEAGKIAYFVLDKLVIKQRGPDK